MLIAFGLFNNNESNKIQAHFAALKYVRKYGVRMLRVTFRFPSETQFIYDYCFCDVSEMHYSLVNTLIQSGNFHLLDQKCCHNIE